MSVDLYPLPAYKHLPGSNARPQDPLLESIAGQATAQTTSDTAHENLAWLYGLRLLNAGYYWESHEVLEAVWMRAPPNSRERFLVQGVIHIANAALKTRMQRPAAAARLSKLAVASFARAYPRPPDTLMGLGKDSVLDAARHCAEEGVSLRI